MNPIQHEIRCVQRCGCGEVDMSHTKEEVEESRRMLTALATAMENQRKECMEQQ